jgi:hypothetical protein
MNNNYRDYQINLKPIEVKVLPGGRLNTKNASCYLGFSEKTLAMKRSQGIGPKFHKRDGFVFYYIDELEDWLAESKAITSTNQAR